MRVAVYGPRDVGISETLQLREASMGYRIISCKSTKAVVFLVADPPVTNDSRTVLFSSPRATENVGNLDNLLDFSSQNS